MLKLQNSRKHLVCWDSVMVKTSELQALSVLSHHVPEAPEQMLALVETHATTIKMDCCQRPEMSRGARKSRELYCPAPDHPCYCSYLLLRKCWQKLDTSTFDFLIFSEIASKGVLKAPVCSKEPLVFVYLKGAWVQYFSPQKAYRSPYRQLTGHLQVTS